MDLSNWFAIFPVSSIGDPYREWESNSETYCRNPDTLVLCHSALLPLDWVHIHSCALLWDESEYSCIYNTVLLFSICLLSSAFVLWTLEARDYILFTSIYLIPGNYNPPSVPGILYMYIKGSKHPLNVLNSTYILVWLSLPLKKKWN